MFFGFLNICNSVFISMNFNDFVGVANSADPGEMPCYLAFYLGLLCLKKCPFRVF